MKLPNNGKDRAPNAYLLPLNIAFGTGNEIELIELLAKTVP